MRKRSAYRPRAAKAPMLVTWHTIPELGLTERQSVEAFVGGWATTDHFDNLADSRDIMTLAAAERHDKQTLILCELALHALLSIKERYGRTKKMGASGEELQALRALVDTSEDFWKRQSGEVFATHYQALTRARQMQKSGAA